MGLYHSPNVVTSGLVMYLDAANIKSYSGAGVSWNDLSANSNSGIITNSPTFNSSNGGSFVFNGSTTFIDSSTNNGLLPTGGLTLAAWVKTSVANKFIIDKAGIATNIGYILAGGSVGGFGIQINTVGLSSSGTITSNNWVYLVGTWVPSTSLNCYINGVLDNTNTSGIPSSITDPSANLWIAKRRNGTDMWNGNIANIQIYNRPLSSGEIIQNFNAHKGRFGL